MPISAPSTTTQLWIIDKMGCMSIAYTYYTESLMFSHCPYTIFVFTSPSQSICTARSWILRFCKNDQSVHSQIFVLIFLTDTHVLVTDPQIVRRAEDRIYHDDYTACDSVDQKYWPFITSRQNEVIEVWPHLHDHFNVTLLS